MTAIPDLVGMIHLDALPGSPRFSGNLNDVSDRALKDAAVLSDAGFRAVMVENFGDVPFFADKVPPETTASMAVIVSRIKDADDLTIGVNVLRNDALSALAIATATDAAFIRVNVLTGTMYTDQGPIVGRAAEIQRSRAVLAPEVEIWADVMVKHATPPPGLRPDQSALDTLHRGRADALVVSGSGTGQPVDTVLGMTIRNTVGSGVRIVIGSGAVISDLAALTSFADSIIVGSSLKEGGDPNCPVDLELATDFVKEANSLGLF